MPGPTQDPEVAQVLSAIRQLIDQSRTPAKPPPLLLTPELRVGGAKPSPAAPRASAPAGIPDPRPAGPLVDAGGPAASAGPLHDGPSPLAPRAQAEGGLLVLDRPILPGPATATPLPLLILGAPAAGPDSIPSSDQADPQPLASESLAAAPPAEEEPLPPRDAAEPPLSTKEGATPATQDLRSDEEHEAPADSVAAEEASGDDAVPLGPAEDATDQDAPADEPEVRAEWSPDRADSGTGEPTTAAAPQAPPFDLPDLSAFMPLAGLPPSITLLSRRPPEPPAVAAEPATQEAPPEAPDLSRAGSEEPAAWTEPDWPELRRVADRPDPAALPEDDLAGLLPAEEPQPEGSAEADPEDPLRERVVVILREEIKREIGDLREVVRQEVRDVLSERDPP